MQWTWYLSGAMAGVALLAAVVVRFIYRDQVRMVRIQWHLMRQRNDRALPLAEAQFEGLRRRKGERHLETATAKYTLGQIRYEHGREEEGRNMVLEAAEVIGELEARSDEEFRMSLMNLGVALRSVGEREAALEVTRKAAALSAASYGNSDWQTAEAMSNVGVLLDETGRSAEALTVHREVLRVKTAEFGKNSVEVAKVLVNLSEAEIATGNYPGARTALERAIAVLEPIGDHTLGHAFDSFAKLEEAQENWEAAERMRAASVMVLERALGRDNAEVAVQMDRYAALLGQLGRPVEVRLARRRASRIRETLA
jgi:tetratricopeptide (TPR) repeat protein